MPSSKLSALSPRRRAVSGGYVRGEEQKAHIIAAAMKVFAQEGYERATTRMIASAANIQPPALQYYFGGKEGLHLACTKHIISRVMPLIAPALAAGRTILPDASPKQAISALCDMIDALVDASVLMHDMPDAALFFAHAQREDAPGAALMKGKVSLRIYKLALQLVAAATGEGRTLETRLRTTMILAQLTAFHAHRETTLRNLGLRSFSPRVLNRAKLILRRHVSAALSEPMRD